MTALTEMDKAVTSLSLQVPGEVWDDVRQRYDALRAAINELREAAKECLPDGRPETWPTVRLRDALWAFEEDVLA